MLTNIFQRLCAKGLLNPREGWIPKHSSSTLNLSKNCAYHLNIQGHDTEECPALRNKIQNMIENGKIIVQQGPLNNNCNPSTANTITIQGDPTNLYSRPLTRKRKSHQRNLGGQKSYEQRLIDPTLNIIEVQIQSQASMSKYKTITLLLFN
ncbi:hypothetical protein H5410_062838 [Solanum commersonii]|uniref:Uncharacterized protein n=1 Tax=Solanum commersonii TaxID=4109 RepID=A0A9J5WDH9_SOLCO|nr:hypothetical protein H5410_062838 [Solanum commersonii]